MQNGKFGVDALARQAVRFLHLCFESDHPRVRGQTVSEVSNKIGRFCIQAKVHEVTRSIFFSPMDGMLVHRMVIHPCIHLGGERHYERKVFCPRTQQHVPGQGVAGSVAPWLEHPTLEQAFWVQLPNIS